MSQQHCNFFLSSRDIRFLKKITRKRPMGQTRWPSIFSSLDVIGSHKKQTKLKYFFQIEDFGFPVSREDAYYQFYKNAPIVDA